jgi:hypothetical protein
LLDTAVSVSEWREVRGFVSTTTRMMMITVISVA